MDADVAQSCGTEERIADGVQQDVRVGVALEPEFVGDLDPAEPQVIAWLEAVHIVAEAGTEWYLHHFT